MKRRHSRQPSLRRRRPASILSDELNQSPMPSTQPQLTVGEQFTDTPLFALETWWRPFDFWRFALRRKYHWSLFDDAQCAPLSTTPPVIAPIVLHDLDAPSRPKLDQSCTRTFSKQLSSLTSDSIRCQKMLIGLYRTAPVLETPGTASLRTVSYLQSHAMLNTIAIDLLKIARGFFHLPRGLVPWPSTCFLPELDCTRLAAVPAESNQGLF